MKKLLYCAVLLGFGISIFAIDSKTASAEAPRVKQTSPADKKTEIFTIVGTEPFWNMTIAKTGIVYSTPEKKQTFPYVAPIAAQGRTLDILRVYRLPDGVNNLILIQKVSSCTDGMSDQKYPYSATLILGNTIREGCANTK